MSTTNICTVCLEPLVRHECPIVATVPCGHSYHEACLKKWATQRFLKLKETSNPEILCPICNASVTNVVKLFLSTKNGLDDSLSGKELESWRKEYDVETKSERLQLHANILDSNKKVIDEIFEKQKILETYENDRKALDDAKGENRKLRHELFQQIMKHEAEIRRMEANKQIITEVLERNEKALSDLKSTREENLDLKRELLKNIMAKQADIKKLAASKQALTVSLDHQEMALKELKKSREENLCLKKELVEHLHHHHIRMEQLHSHKESLHGIVVQHGKNVQELEAITKENLELKEGLLQSMELHKADSSKLATCQGWLEVLKDEVSDFEQERASLKLMRTENYRLGTVVTERHRRWLQARRDLQERIHKSATAKTNFLIVLGQVVVLGFAVHSLNPA